MYSIINIDFDIRQSWARGKIEEETDKNKKVDIEVIVKLRINT